MYHYLQTMKGPSTVIEFWTINPHGPASPTCPGLWDSSEINSWGVCADSKKQHTGTNTDCYMESSHLPSPLCDLQCLQGKDLKGFGSNLKKQKIKQDGLVHIHSLSLSDSFSLILRTLGIVDVP